MSDVPSQALSELDVLARLRDLEVESQARQAELREIAAQLPAVVSRRAMLRSMVADARRHPHKGEVVRRGVAKIGRAPRALWRRLRGHQW